MEMLRLVGALREEYAPRIYVVSRTDHISQLKAAHLEEQRTATGMESKNVC